MTQVRSHYVLGPLNIELVYNTEKGVKTINSTLGALATHAVAGLTDSSSKLIDFIIDRYDVVSVILRSDFLFTLTEQVISFSR